MAPFIRIALRLVIGYLFAKGFIPEDVSAEISDNPDVIAAIETAVLTAVGIVNEAWYLMSRRFGWSK